MKRAPKTNDRSTLILLSLAVPGAGHWQLGRKGRGAVFLAWFGLLCIVVLLGYLILFFTELRAAEELAISQWLPMDTFGERTGNVTWPAMVATFANHAIFWIVLGVQLVVLPFLAAWDVARLAPKTPKRSA